jgi:beta-lactamase class D
VKKWQEERKEKLEKGQLENEDVEGEGDNFWLNG